MRANQRWTVNPRTTVAGSRMVTSWERAALGALLIGGALVFAASARATPTVEASQTYYIGNSVNQTDSDTIVADVLPTAANGPNSIFGHSYAYPDGTNGSRSSGSNTYGITGYSVFSDTYTNTTGASATFYFPFTITAGELAVQMAADAVGNQTASVGAQILLTSSFDPGNPVTALSYDATMVLDTTGDPSPFFNFIEGGLLNGSPLSLAGGIASGSGTTWSYAWSAYSDTIEMTLAAGESVTVDYKLSSSANGDMVSLGSCTGTGYGDPLAPQGGIGVTLTNNVVLDGGSTPPEVCFNAAMGRIGDPFHPEIVPQAAPEPFSLALLGTGLFGIVAARRRR